MAFVTDNPAVFWFVLLIAFSVIEAVTVQLVSVWFALGSIGALIAAFLGAKFLAQITVFIIVSVICIIATRPIIRKFHSKGVQSTNADRCIGQNAMVIEQIDNMKAQGQVRVNGNVWTARSEDNEIIPVETIVKIVKIEGVKLIVKTEKE